MMLSATIIMSFFNNSKIILTIFIVLIFIFGGFGFWQNQTLNQQIKNLTTEKDSLYKEKESYKIDLNIIQAKQNEADESTLVEILNDEQVLKIIQSAKTETIEGWNPDFVKNTTGKKLEKIADIPDDILAKIGVPPQGFVFNDNVVYWVGDVENLNTRVNSGNNIYIYNGSKINKIDSYGTLIISNSKLTGFLPYFSCFDSGVGCRGHILSGILDIKNGLIYKVSTDEEYKKITTYLRRDYINKWNFYENPGEANQSTVGHFSFIHNKNLYGVSNGRLVRSDGDKIEVLQTAYSDVILKNNKNQIISLDLSYADLDNSCFLKDTIFVQNINTLDIEETQTHYHDISANIDFEDCYKRYQLTHPDDLEINKNTYEAKYKKSLLDLDVDPNFIETMRQINVG
jgi:hypothetical protein